MNLDDNKSLMTIIYDDYLFNAIDFMMFPNGITYLPE